MHTLETIEFFGLAGVQKEYDRIREAKRVFACANNILLIELYPVDVLPDILKKYL